MRMRGAIFAAVLAAVALLAPRAGAQECGPGWLPVDGFRGVSGLVNAVVNWDPDGPGPRPAVLVVGGLFQYAGAIEAGNIAAWNPVTGRWSKLGEGTNGEVQSLAVLPNGRLVAGGKFTAAGGAAALGIAACDGENWAPVGGGLTGNPQGATEVRALAVMRDGALVAGGNFRVAGGAPAVCIARWDGNVWSPLGPELADPPFFQPQVMALAVLPTGDLVVGGVFTRAGTLVANAIVRWDGERWWRLAEGLQGSLRVVRGLAVLPDGGVVAGGDFTTAGTGPAYNVARWDGSQWHGMGGGRQASVWAVGVLPTGEAVACAQGPPPIGGVAKWNGSEWVQLAPETNSNVRAAPLFTGSGELVLAGGFSVIGNTPVGGVAVLRGGEWRALNSGFGGRNGVSQIMTLRTLRDGTIIAGGEFTGAGGVLTNSVARWDGEGWSPVGPVSPGASPQIYSIVELANGDLVAAHFGTVVRWDGAAWLPIGGTFSERVLAVAELPNGDLLAGGRFTSVDGVPAPGIARWTGSAWGSLGGGVAGPVGTTPWVSGLLVRPGGEVIACGSFESAGGTPAKNIARWDGGAWSALGSGLTYPAGSLATASGAALATDPDGGVMVVGQFAFAGGVAAQNVARWDGAAWTALGPGAGNALGAIAVTPTGRIFVGGSAGPFPTAARLWEWDGSTWVTIGSGNPLANNGSVLALAALPGGELAVGGRFVTMGGRVAVSFARFSIAGAAPAITEQPASATACSGGWAQFWVGATGTGELTYRWQIRTGPGVWLDLTTSPLPLPCGGVVVASAPAAAETAVSVTPCPGVESYAVRCVVSNGCGSTVSGEAEYRVCYANCDCSGASPGLNVSDYICFLNRFAAADPYANCDGSTTPPVLNVADFVCFAELFAVGCP